MVGPRLKLYDARTIRDVPQVRSTLQPEALFDLQVVSTVLPFLETFAAAHRQVSGLARTVRGPCMATDHGKVVVEGEARVAGERVFVLSFVQARDPAWCRRPFFARYDASATWLDQLEPALGEPPFPVLREPVPSPVLASAG